MDQERIDEVISTKRKVPFATETIGESWDFVKKDFGSYFGYLVIIILASMAFGFLFQWIQQQTGVYVSGINQIFSPFISAGFLYFYKDSLGKNASFESFFKPFSNAKPFIIWGLLSVAIAIIIIALPMIIFLGASFATLSSLDPNTLLANMATGGFVSGVLGVVVIYYLILLLFSMVLPILVFNEGIGIIQAVKLSIHSVKNNYFSFLGYFILMILILFVSAIPCGLGLIATFPMIAIGPGIIYVKIFGMEQAKGDQMIEEFGGSEDDFDSIDEL